MFHCLNSLEIMQQFIIVPVDNLNVEIMKNSTHGGGGGSGRVESDFLSAISGRAGSGRVNASPGRVQEK